MSKAKKPDFDPIGHLIRRAGKSAFTPTSKGVLKQRDRESRVQYILDHCKIRGLSPPKILEVAQRENISIDQIEKRIVLPLAELKGKNEKEYKKAARKYKNGTFGGIWLIILIGIGLWYWLGGK